ncbi:zinc-binding dehydrogenase [Azospirillum sp. YIM B02556]|uniref:Zinc-binding dehydrogenase n=1 Tax=Azospirillum endophyticum TaxID=2800326 RepID=A0ABS1FAH4_9PROT|nr:zinc-binding dehydrogenase [Azospirillum endophyticum]MBK1840426.1 zinc-binding dehydrogenase [Azospirillum endophyticum]
MRAAVYFKHGKPEEVLRAVDVADPAGPGRGEVLVRVLLRPVHHGDLLGVAGRYQPGSVLPEGGVRVGFEGYGIVEQAGEGVALAAGARIAFFPGRGAWSEKAVVSADYVTEIPDTVSDEAAAQLHVNPLTTALLLRAVEASGAKPGRDVVVLTAAGSAVARLTIGLLLERGYDVVGIVRREAGVNELNVVFPDLPVVSTDKSGWEKRVVSAADGRPVGVVLDPVGGETASAAAGLLSQGGSLISYGDLSGQPISIPALYVSTRGIRISGVTVGRWAELSPEMRKADLKLALELAAGRPELFPVAKTFDLAEVGEAAAFVERPGKMGTVLLSSR